MQSHSTEVGCALAFAALLTLAGCSDGQPQTARGTPAATQAAAATIDPCTLVTREEVAAAVGWTVQSVSPIPAGCSFIGPNDLQDVASIVLSAGMRPMSSSEEMAAWRREQTQSPAYSNIDFIIEPIDDLGVPAIRNQIGSGGIVGVESYVRGRLLTVSTSTLEASRALTRNAMARIP